MGVGLLLLEAAELLDIVATVENQPKWGLDRWPPDTDNRAGDGADWRQWPKSIPVASNPTL